MKFLLNQNLSYWTGICIIREEKSITVNVYFRCASPPTFKIQSFYHNEVNCLAVQGPLCWNDVTFDIASFVQGGVYPKILCSIFVNAKELIVCRLTWNTSSIGSVRYFPDGQISNATQVIISSASSAMNISSKVKRRINIRCIYVVSSLGEASN